MKRLLFGLVALGLAVSPGGAASPLYLSADVPTTETATSSTFQPSQVVRYAVGPVSYTVALPVPGNSTLDAIEKMDRPMHWLFSLEAPSDLAGALGGAAADPRDVIRFDGASVTYSFFFCGAAAGVPLGANVDALYLDGGDTGDLVVSFDVPATVGAFDFDPSDLVRFTRTGPSCGDWTVAATNPAFDASAAGAGIPPSANVTAADKTGNLLILTFDAPVDLGPPGVTTYFPGQVVSWDGVSFGLFESIAGWPIGSVTDGLARLANPGRIPATLKVNRVPASSAIVIDWSGSCSDGGEDYGIYEGRIGFWYTHTLKTCMDTGTPLTEQVLPGPGNRYYLVVPRNAVEEGSYGKSDNFPIGFDTERPVGVSVCAPAHVLTPCPP